MEVMHERVAGLYVHKETVVACVRIVAGGKVSRECPNLRDHNSRPGGLAGLVDAERMYACRDGGYGRLLEACVEHPERWQV